MGAVADSQHDMGVLQNAVGCLVAHNPRAHGLGLRDTYKGTPCREPYCVETSVFNVCVANCPSSVRQPLASQPFY